MERQREGRQENLVSGKKNLYVTLSANEAELGMTVILVMCPHQHNMSISSLKKPRKTPLIDSTSHLHSSATALSIDYLQMSMSALINLYCPLVIDNTQVFRVSVRMKDSYLLNRTSSMILATPR